MGDHPLTIFDTGASIVFDQSHIFFDGAWGAALAEILTNEALAWAAQLSSLPAAGAAAQHPQPLKVAIRDADAELIEQAPCVMAEAGAETEQVDMKAILLLRKTFKQRNDLLQLTVNDLLILYRAIHVLTYQPDSALSAALQAIGEKSFQMLEQSCQPARSCALSVRRMITRRRHSSGEW